MTQCLCNGSCIMYVCTSLKILFCLRKKVQNNSNNLKATPANPPPLVPSAAAKVTVNWSAPSSSALLSESSFLCVLCLWTAPDPGKGVETSIHYTHSTHSGAVLISIIVHIIMWPSSKEPVLSCNLGSVFRCIYFFFETATSADYFWMKMKTVVKKTCWHCGYLKLPRVMVALKDFACVIVHIFLSNRVLDSS